MASSTLKKTVKSTSITATTGATGNLDIHSVIPSGAVPVSAQCTSPYMGIPFKSGATWYLKVIAYNSASYSPANSVSITANVWYVE